MAPLAHLCHCVRQDFEASSFACSGVADKHNTKSYKESLVELDHFLFEDFMIGLQTFQFKALFDLFNELGIVWLDDG